MVHGDVAPHFATAAPSLLAPFARPAPPPPLAAPPRPAPDAPPPGNASNAPAAPPKKKRPCASSLTSSALRLLVHLFYPGMVHGDVAPYFAIATPSLLAPLARPAPPPPLAAPLA